MNGLDNEVISCNLFQFTTLNKNIFAEETDKDVLFIDPNFIDEISRNMPNYYLINILFIILEDYNSCYGISFIILPYFDERLLELKMYHSYNL